MDKFRKDVKKAMSGQTVTTVPSAPVDNTSDDKSNQKINAMNGTVTVIYKGEDGLNIRKAPSYTAAVDQIVHEGVFTVVGISADEKWYKLKSGLFITTIPDYVSFKATQEQKEPDISAFVSPGTRPTLRSAPSSRRKTQSNFVNRIAVTKSSTIQEKKFILALPPRMNPSCSA